MAVCCIKSKGLLKDVIGVENSEENRSALLQENANNDEQVQHIGNHKNNFIQMGNRFSGDHDEYNEDTMLHSSMIQHSLPRLAKVSKASEHVSSADEGQDSKLQIKEGVFPQLLSSLSMLSGDYCRK